MNGIQIAQSLVIVYTESIVNIYVYVQHLYADCILNANKLTLYKLHADHVVACTER